MTPCYLSHSSRRMVPLNNLDAVVNIEENEILSQIERRREFTYRLNLRRSVYRELTVFQKFPLQDMAMKHFDKKLKAHFPSNELDIFKRISIDEDGKTVSSSEHAILENEEHHLGEFVTNNEPTGTQVSQQFHTLKKNFLQEFMKEQLYFSRENFIANDETAYGEFHLNDNQENIQSCNKPHVKTTKKSQNQIEVQNKLQSSPFSKITYSNSSIQHGHRKNNDVASDFLSALWSMDPRIFAMETPVKGKRRYISCHLGRFMDHYWRECDPINRHYYELIKENTHCRLYFDLEFSKLSNLELTPATSEDMLNELFNEIQCDLKTHYKISIQRCHLVDLDSSTSKKFSRHWIFHLPNGELFHDAYATGVFVKSLFHRLQKERESGALQMKGHELLSKHLFVNNECLNDGNLKLTPFIDLGVYTRNRLFRLMGSTKFGKRVDAALRIARENKYPFPGGFDNSKFYPPEMNIAPKYSLNENESSRYCQEDYENFCKSLNWEDHATALERTLVIPSRSSMENSLILACTNGTQDSKDQEYLILEKPMGPFNNGLGAKMMSRSISHKKSPFPQLENFIMNELGKKGGIQGIIGTFSMGKEQPFSRTITFNMRNNRYCENIGRAHKSNNIIWNVHLIDKLCWQSCHDPDCRGFRSELIFLPDEVNNEIDDYFIDHELSSINESQIVSNLLEIPVNVESTENEFDDPLLEEAMRKLNITPFNE